MSFSDVSRLARGDIVLIRFPFTDLSSDKRRPAILVTDTANASGTDGHFVFMGSNTPPAGEPCIAIAQGSPEATAMGLRFQVGKPTAYVRPRKIATLAVCLVTRRIGVAPTNIMQQLDSVLRAGLGL